MGESLFVGWWRCQRTLCEARGRRCMVILYNESLRCRHGHLLHYIAKLHNGCHKGCSLFRCWVYRLTRQHICNRQACHSHAKLKPATARLLGLIEPDSVGLFLVSVVDPSADLFNIAHTFGSHCTTSQAYIEYRFLPFCSIENYLGKARTGAAWPFSPTSRICTQSHEQYY